MSMGSVSSTSDSDGDNAHADYRCACECACVVRVRRSGVCVCVCVCVCVPRTSSVFRNLKRFSAFWVVFCVYDVSGKQGVVSNEWTSASQ